MSKKITNHINHLFKDKQNLALTIMVIVTLFSFIMLFSAFGTTKNIIACVDNKTPGEKHYEVQNIQTSLMSTLGQICTEGKINIDVDHYNANVDMQQMAKDFDQVIFTKKITGVIQADGKQTEFESSAETVGDVLKENGIELDEDDFSIPDVKLRLTENISIIAVVRVTTAMESVERDMAFETEYIDNNNMNFDEENTISEGVNGREIAVEKITYYDGKEFNRQTISRATLVEPVKRIAERGTKTPAGGAARGGNQTATIGDQFEFICAVVAQEGGYSYDGALAVISCIMNRADSGRWGGSDVMSVITAPGQFEAYLSGAYTRRLGTAMPEVERAVTDCMENGVRNHTCQSFRGYYVEGGTAIGGNYYF